jgi:hypothetical protein
VSNVLAITDLAYIPLLLSHTTPPVYIIHCMTNQKRLLVTGVIS